MDDARTHLDDGERLLREVDAPDVVSSACSPATIRAGAMGVSVSWRFRSVGRTVR